MSDRPCGGGRPWRPNQRPTLQQRLDAVGGPSFTCPRCGATSFNPNDVDEGYCGRCHWWTGDPVMGRLVSPSDEARTESPLGARSG